MTAANAAAASKWLLPPEGPCTGDYYGAAPAAQVAVDVNNTPLESTAVIVTTTPTFSVGNVKVMFEGEVAIVAVAGVTPTTDDERTYGAKPPLIVYTMLRPLHWVLGTAGIAARAAVGRT